MLFILHCEIAPEHRDENLRRLEAMRIGQRTHIKIVGALFSVTQLEGWVIFEVPDGAALSKFFHNWTDLSVNTIVPILDVADALRVLEENR